MASVVGYVVFQPFEEGPDIVRILEMGVPSLRLIGGSTSDPPRAAARAHLFQGREGGTEGRIQTAADAARHRGIRHCARIVRQAVHLPHPLRLPQYFEGCGRVVHVGRGRNTASAVIRLHGCDTIREGDVGGGVVAVAVAVAVTVAVTVGVRGAAAAVAFAFGAAVREALGAASPTYPGVISAVVEEFRIAVSPCTGREGDGAEGGATEAGGIFRLGIEVMVAFGA
mmetsp:Transcript_41076/g.80401  ORF Transcript_41076/g.80401 Transcript_41076/m.80401 type:complete len:226 (-) Transcript_41076:552-1229(-)